MAIDVLLGKDFIDEHILLILPDKRQVTSRDSNPFAIAEQGNKPDKAVLNTIATKRVLKKTIYETGNLAKRT